MKKTLVALAALAATSAFAQSSVTLSGRASMDVSSFSATGATAGPAQDLKSRMRVADTSSRITFAANEDLGGGMRAGVYCETGINIDSGNANGQANTANANTSEFCSREGRAYVGLGEYELRLGRQNVWWTQGALNQTGSTYLGSDSMTNLINGGAGVYGVRLENMVKFAVTQGQFAGSELYTGVMGAGTGEAAAVNTDANGKYSGFKLQYTTGPYVAMIDQQSSKNSAATAAAATVVGARSFNREATKFGLGFKYNPTSIVSIQTWSKKRTDVADPTRAFNQTVTVNTTNEGNAKDTGYGIQVHHDLGGGWMAHAQWAKANNIKNTTVGEVADTGAKGITLGATKAFSKRTHVYGAYHKITNQSAAIYGMAGGNYQSGAAQAGADTKMLALGMIHNF